MRKTKTFNWIIIGLLLLVLALDLVQGVTWYIDPDSGDDTYSGNITHPFKTIVKGVSVVNNGDIIRLLSGTYYEKVNSLNAVYFSKEITIEGEHKDNVIVTMNDSTANRMFYTGNSNVTFSNFTINMDIGTYNTSASTQYMIVFSVGTGNMNTTIKDMNLIGGITNGISFGSGSTYQAKDVNIIRNTFVNITRYCTFFPSGGFLNLTYNNNTFNAPCDLLYTSSNNDNRTNTINPIEYNNIIYNGTGVATYNNGFNIDSYNTRNIDNVIIRNNQWGTPLNPTSLSIAKIRNTYGTAEIYNNTFYLKNTYYYGIYMLNSGSIRNNFFGSNTSYNNANSSYNLIQIPFLNNVTVENNVFYDDNTNISYSIIYALDYNNSIIRNNLMYIKGFVYSAIFVGPTSAHNSYNLLIENNTIHTSGVLHGGYTLAIGSETQQTGNITNAIVRNNIINTTDDISSSYSTHHFMAFYTDNISVYNNYVRTGNGNYGILSKGNENCLYYNNTIVFRRNGLTDKASYDCVYRDNIFIPNFPIPTNQNFYRLANNPSDGRNTINATFINNYVTDRTNFSNLKYLYVETPLGGGYQSAIIINETFNSSDMVIPSEGYVSKSWWYNAKVYENNSVIPVYNANVFLRNSSNGLINSYTTNESGHIPILNISEFVYNNSVLSYNTYNLEWNYTLTDSSYKTLNLTTNNLSDILYIPIPPRINITGVYRKVLNDALSNWEIRLYTVYSGIIKLINTSFSTVDIEGLGDDYTFNSAKVGTVTYPNIIKEVEIEVACLGTSANTGYIQYSFSYKNGYSITTPFYLLPRTVSTSNHKYLNVSNPYPDFLVNTITGYAYKNDSTSYPCYIYGFKQYGYNISGLVYNFTPSTTQQVAGNNVYYGILNSTGYFERFFNFTTTSTFTEYEITDIYNNYLTITFKDAFTNTSVNTFSGNAMLGDWGENFNTTNGSVTIGLLADNSTYNLYAESPDYSVSDDSYQNITLDSSFFNVTFFSQYINNSVYFRIYDETTGLSLNGTNVSVIISGDELEQTNYTSTGELFVGQIKSGVYNVKIQDVAESYGQRSYILTIASRSTQDLDVYLINSTYYTVLTITDAGNGQVIKDATVNMYRYINGSYVVVSSALSDITGKTQFNFDSGVKYRFIIIKEGYTETVFDLDPILFTAYTVPISKESGGVTNAPDYYGVNVLFFPIKFFDNETNSFTWGIVAGEGVLENYRLNISYPTGGFKEFSGSNSIGEMFTTTFNITGAGSSDYVIIEYCYNSVYSEEKCFKFNYLIDGSSNVGTWERNMGELYGMGILERIIIVTITVIIIAGLGSIFLGELAGGIIGLFLFGFFFANGFVPLWSILPSIFVGIIYIGSKSK